MRPITFLMLILALPLMADPVVIGHSGMPQMSLITLQRIYTGKIVEVDGQRVNPIQLPRGAPLRVQFLRTYLDQDDAEYIAYWTVRRYVGKGTPPRELEQAREIIQFVSKTPGAIGYVDESDLPPQANVLLRSP